MDPTTTLSSPFTAPTEPLSVNATNGKSYQSSHFDKPQCQRAASAAFRAAAADLAPYRGHRVKLTFCLPRVAHKSADSGNFIGAMSWTGARDALARSLRMIPQGTMEWLITDADFWAGDATRTRSECASVWPRPIGMAADHCGAAYHGGQLSTGEGCEEDPHGWNAGRVLAPPEQACSRPESEFATVFAP